MQVSEVNLKPLFRGDPRSIVFEVKDPAGVPIDLSGSSWVSTIRSFSTATAGTALTVDVTQAAVGILRLDIPGETSRPLGRRFVGDLQGSGLFGTVVRFHVDVIADVTRGTIPLGGTVDVVNIVWGGVPSAEVSTSLRVALLRSKIMLPYSMPGQLKVGVGATPFPIAYACQLLSYAVRGTTAPAGSSLIFDFNRNGSTLFTTQANRPTVTPGSTTSTVVLPDVVTLSAGDWLTVDVDQVGSVDPGSDFVASIHLAEL